MMRCTFDNCQTPFVGRLPYPLLLAIVIGCTSPKPTPTIAPSAASSETAIATPATSASNVAPIASATPANSTAETPAPRVVCIDCYDEPIIPMIQFEHKSSKLSPQGLEVLEGVYQTLVAHPKVIIEIRGYIDSSEKEYYQHSFGYHRAEAIRKFLISRGIEARRLVVKDYGEGRPLVVANTPENRAKNRRVDFQVIKTPEKP